MKVSSVILLIYAWSCCSNNVVGQLVADLPFTVQTDLLSILTTGTVVTQGTCTTSLDASQVQYWLYTRQNPTTPIILNSLDAINSTKPIIILVPGWFNTPDDSYNAPIRDGYLQRYDCNLIAVYHAAYTDADYFTAYCHVPSIGYALGQLLCNISSTLSVSVSDMHMVGNSLGAQMCGFAGSAVKSLCGTLGRISGLDPAGPLYQGADISQRLDKSDAQFVDVIHTNEGEFGYIGDVGDVDFYPNCGSNQPGCFTAPVTSLTDLLIRTVEALGCSHGRSCLLFAESINSNSFFSTSCLKCGVPNCQPDSVFNATYTYMGESCRSQPPRTEYVLTTKGVPPYAMGPQGPLN